MQLLYGFAPGLQPSEYLERLTAGWRRMGPVIFRPDCPGCCKCLSLRVPVNSFRLSRTQRRILNRNTTDVGITIAVPTMTGARLELFKAFHEHGHQMKGWPAPGNDIDGEAESRLELFLRNPFRTEEWTYWIGDRLVGVGYVDALAEGLSAIYFFHDPREHRRSLGTFNILKVIEAAGRRDLPHVYTGVLTSKGVGRWNTRRGSGRTRFSATADGKRSRTSELPVDGGARLWAAPRVFAPAIGGVPTRIHPGWTLHRRQVYRRVGEAVITVLVVAQLTIVASAPPLPPADAARTLQRASPDLDLSRGLFRLEELPIVLNVSPSTSHGRRAPGELVPLVAVPPWEPKPLVREIPGITFGLPHGWWKVQKDGRHGKSADDAPERAAVQRPETSR